MVSFKCIDFWPKILLFRTHHLWNSTTELILTYISLFIKYLYVLILDIHNINAIFEEEFSYLPGSQVEDTTRGWKRWSGRISRGASSLASEVSKSRHAFQCLKFRPINQKENQCKIKRTTRITNHQRKNVVNFQISAQIGITILRLHTHIICTFSRPDLQFILKVSS